MITIDDAVRNVGNTIVIRTHDDVMCVGVLTTVYADGTIEIIDDREDDHWMTVDAIAAMAVI